MEFRQKDKVDGISPTLHFIQFLQFSMSQGSSLRVSIESYLDQFESEITMDLKKFWIRLNGKGDVNEISSSINSDAKRFLFELISMGYNGIPILPTLENLSKQIVNICHSDVERQLQRLPVVALAPLVLFQFPAFLLLVLGPIVTLTLGALN